jgi:hypothetical protein
MLPKPGVLSGSLGCRRNEQNGTLADFENSLSDAADEQIVNGAVSMRTHDTRSAAIASAVLESLDDAARRFVGRHFQSGMSQFP